MRITYVTLDTELWGGICVVFQHLELLAEHGFDAFLTTPANKPDWYNLKVPLHKIERLDASLIPSADIVVATSWHTIKPVVESRKGAVVHLCQGYEGGYKELASLKPLIDEAYAYSIPKLTVSHHLDGFLRERFNAETYYVGQMLDSDMFRPADVAPAERLTSPAHSKTIERIKDLFRKRSASPLRVIVVGPFEVDFKNIPAALKGIAIAKKLWNLPIKVIRVSQFPLSAEEKKIIEPDEFHFHIPHHHMGELYRSADLFISMSKEAEGFGLPALEAMACGVPVILSGISSYRGFEELPDYALFVDPPTPEMVALAIKKIASEPSLRRHLIDRGGVVAGKFTKEKVLQRLTNAFGKILHGT